MNMFKRIFWGAVFCSAGLLNAGHASAEGITSASSCQVISGYLDNSDTRGVAVFTAYTLGQFKVFDGERSNGSSYGIFNLLSTEQVNNTAAIAAMWCSTHPERSVHDAAMFAYEGAVQLGGMLASSK